jgi:putative transcriptional regulator
MSIVRRSKTSLSETEAARLIDLAQSRTFTETEIDAMAATDDSVWTDENLANATHVYPVQTPEDVRDLRTRMGLSQAQFAQKFGLTLDTVQQYEQGRRRPSGPASTLLRVIEAEPDAVVRALKRR